MKNKVLIIFPPGWIATAPYLALPQLKGFANSLSENLDIYDDNIHFFDYIFSKDYLLNKLSFCKCRFKTLKQKYHFLKGNDLEKFQQLYRGLKYSQYFKEVDSCKNILRSNRNESEYMKAYKVFMSALDLVGYCFNMCINQNIIYSKIYEDNTIENLLKFSKDIKNNIFIEYYTNTTLIKKCLSYDFVGISITSASQMLSAFTLLTMIKKKDPQKRLKLFLGGNFITRLCENTDDEKILIHILDLIDFISVFEGEPLISNIFSPEFNYKLNNNIIYLDKNKVIRNLITPNVYTDIPTLPDFDGFPLSLYFLPKLVLPLISSKNCYNNCAFCTIPKGTYGRKYIQFNLQILIQNIFKLIEKYNTTAFSFNDEVFALNRMLKFANSVLENNLDISWLCETRFDYLLTKSDFEIIFNSGCKSIQFGLESYNQRILGLMKKNININDIDIIIDNVLSVGISIHLFCIFGFPTETEEEASNTKNYIFNFLNKAKNEYKLPLTSVGYGTFGLEKGSDVFSNSQNYSLTIIKPDILVYDYKYDYKVITGISQERAKEIVLEMSGGNELFTQVYTPENFVLCVNCEYNDPTPINLNEIIFTNKFKFCPLIGKTLSVPMYYYHKIDNELILSSENNINLLTPKERGIFVYYDLLLNVKKSSLNFQNLDKFFINPYFEIRYNDDRNYIAYDNLTKETFSLTNEFYTIHKLITAYGIKNVVDEMLKQSIFTLEEICNILDEFIVNGLLISNIE